MNKLHTCRNATALALLSAGFTILLAFIGCGSTSTTSAYLTDSDASMSTITIASAPREAFAIYSEDDSSFSFYKRHSVPKAGDVFEGKTVTYIWKNIETNRYGYSSPWSSASKTVSVTVVDDISPIDCSHWFSGMSKCTSMDLKKLDTSNVLEMDRLFYMCESLVELDLSYFDTSKVTDMSEMFYRDKALARIGGIANWDVSATSNMYRMFNGCAALEELDLSKWNAASCTKMEQMFEDCKALGALDVSGFDVSGVTSFFYVFDHCEKLTAIEGLSSWNTSSCTNMYGMFKYCLMLEQADISGFDTSKVTNMGWMLSWCPMLAELDLSGWDTGSVTGCGYMFNAVFRVQRISFGEKWTIPFDECGLHLPYSAYIEGTDEKWHNETTGEAYAAIADMPVGIAAVYVAVPPDAVEATADGAAGSETEVAPEGHIPDTPPVEDSSPDSNAENGFAADATEGETADGTADIGTAGAGPPSGTTAESDSLTADIADQSSEDAAVLAQRSTSSSCSMLETCSEECFSITPSTIAAISR